MFNEDGDDYFFGYKSAINEEEPVPHLVVTGIFANTEDLKDGNGEMQVIELQVCGDIEIEVKANERLLG